MLWGIMNLQLSGDLACFLSRKGLVQRDDGMGIEIVHDKYNLLFVRVAGVAQSPAVRCSRTLICFMPPRSLININIL